MIAFLLSLIVAVATPDVRVVEIHAKRFSFTPDTVTLQQGERVTIRLIADDKLFRKSELARFGELARSDPSPVVRLALASALQRMTTEDRWPITYCGAPCLI